MAFKYSGDSILGVSLRVESPKPLDIRTVVSNTSELYTIDPVYAYEGMAVANASNGNIYVLVDKANIGNSTGWKASYESVQILTYTQDEYDELAANTTEDFKPKDETKGFLHEDTYYYIYENDTGQYYLSSSWGANIEEQLSKKASASSVQALVTKTDETNQNIADNYTTTAELEETYATKEEVSEVDTKVSDLAKTVEDVDNSKYNKTEVDEKFVTKESLKGDTDDDDFIFVTQNKYNTDQALNAKKFTTEELVTQGIDLTGVKVTVQNATLQVNSESVALDKNIPKIECLSQTDYDNMEDKQDDTYYLTYGEKSDIDTGYVSSEYLTEYYYTKKEVDELIKQAIQDALGQ